MNREREREKERESENTDLNLKRTKPTIWLIYDPVVHVTSMLCTCAQTPANATHVPIEIPLRTLPNDGLLFAEKSRNPSFELERV